MKDSEKLEGALRSALMTMSIAAGILEKGDDAHGLAWNLRNEVAQGAAALGIAPSAECGSGSHE